MPYHLRRAPRGALIPSASRHTRHAVLMVLALAAAGGTLAALRAGGLDGNVPAVAAPSDVQGLTNLVINELDYDQPGTDTADFVEIYNAGSVTVSLAGVAVLGVNGDGSIYRRINLPPDNLVAGDWYVVGSAVVPNVDHIAGTTSIFQNGAPDAVALVWTPTGNAVDDQLIDSISYEGEVPGGPATGGSWAEGSSAPTDDGGTHFLGLSRLPDGADTDDNSVDFSLRCITPGKANVEAAADCSDPASEPTPTPTAGPSPTPTATIEPTATPTPTATAGPSPTPTDLPDIGDLAIELDAFTAQRDGRRVRLKWRTLAEIDHAAFRILRQPADLSVGPVHVGVPIAPLGDAFSGASYERVDSEAPADALRYWLEDIDTRGQVTRHGPVHVPPTSEGATLPGGRSSTRR